MRIMLGHSIKRLRREGAKSLSVPLIALVLVTLINLLGGIRAWLDYLYEDTMENFPIVAVVSNTSGDNTDELEIGMRHINLFLDPDVSLSLAKHTGEISLRRTIDDFSIPGYMAEISLIGILGARSDASLNAEYGVVIDFFEGYDESAFHSEDLICVVSEDLYMLVDNGTLSIATDLQLPGEIVPIEGVTVTLRPNGEARYTIEHVLNPGPYQSKWTETLSLSDDWWYTIAPGEIVSLEKKLTVIGTVTGAGYNKVYSPFWAISALAAEADDALVYSELLNVTLKDNSDMSSFKELAGLSFTRTTPFSSGHPFAITVYDSEFYETLEPLRQNIIVVDIATPFIYILSIAIGFLTSVLLTRRRKAEFAIMRSIGVSKWVVFISALTEQATLSLAGAALGFLFVALAWGYSSLERPAIFLACYLLGAVFAAIGAAGTNVMKVLRDRGE